MEYHEQPTPWMREVSDLLFDNLVGVDNCIYESGSNLIVEVPRSDIEAAIVSLRTRFHDVADIRKAYPMMDVLHDFILVKPMISESPVFMEGNISVPSVEKILVDKFSDREYAHFDTKLKQKEFQRAFEIYGINKSRLLRYAARKGKKDEILNALSAVDESRVNTVHNLCRIMAESPICKAWVFGSFARMEERPDSDIDVLVDFEKDFSLGLLGFSRLVQQMESAVGRKVDLVEHGSLKSFARESVEKEKVLIYERTS